MICALFMEKLSLWSWVWQSTLFALIGLAGSFLLRHRPARACQVLFLAMVAAVVVPVTSVLIAHFGLGLFAPEPVAREPETPYEIVATYGQTLDDEAPEAALSIHIQAGTGPVDIPVDRVSMEPAPLETVPQSAGIPWRSFFLYGWMIAALVLLGRLCIAFAGGVRLLRRTKLQNCERIQRAADTARARLGVTKGLRIRGGEDVRSPMIWCWSNPPVLLVPADLEDNVNWVDVICHELAHWMRRDHLTGLMAELAVCILSWNPLLWWAGKRIVRLSEQACDDWVLAGGRAGTDYAQSLLNLSPKVQMAFLPTIIGKEKPMKERIYRIVKEKCGDPRIGVRWALAMTIIAATLTVGVAFAQRRPAGPETTDRGERPAPEERERQVLSERRVELEGRARELGDRIARTEDELAELEAAGKADSEQAQSLRTERRRMRGEMGRMEQELRGVASERREREIRQPREGEEQRREILRRLEELGHETELALGRLEERRLGSGEEADALYRHMRGLNEQMREIRRELGRQLEEPQRRRPEAEGRERPEIDRRIQELARQLEELKLNSQDKERTLRELQEQGKGETDDALAIRRNLEEIHARMQAAEQELGTIERERAPAREARIRVRREPVPEAMVREQEELRQRARQIERELREMGDEHPEKAEQLGAELREIRGRLESRPDVRLSGSGAEIRVQPRVRMDREKEPELVIRQRELEEQARRIERSLGELGDGHPEQAGELRAQLDEVHQQMEIIERERGGFGPDGPLVRERDDLERQVQELRTQVNSVNEQMGELRELLKRLLEEGSQRERR